MKTLRNFVLPYALGLACVTSAFAQTSPTANPPSHPSDNQNNNPPNTQPSNNPPSNTTRSMQHSNSDQPVSDTWITTKVKSELATTEGVKSLDISVKTVNGVVTLTGTQPNDIAVKKAVAAAQSVKGVTNVDSSGLKVKATTDRTSQ